MKPFDRVQSFIERTTDMPSTQELSQAFLDVIEHLGFVHFACFSHVDPLRPPPGTVVLQNYPEAWVREYSERRLHEIDPVLQRAETSALPFLWDICELQHDASEKQQIMLADARPFVSGKRETSSRTAMSMMQREGWKSRPRESPAIRR